VRFAARPLAGGSGAGNASGFTLEDQAALERIASTTGAKAFRARSAGQLLDVFRALPTHIQTSTERHEISVAFVAAATVIGLLALGLSIRWNLR
jgi:hypothetical protein